MVVFKTFLPLIYLFPFSLNALIIYSNFNFILCMCEDQKIKDDSWAKTKKTCNCNKLHKVFKFNGLVISKYNYTVNKKSPVWESNFAVTNPNSDVFHSASNTLCGRFSIDLLKIDFLFYPDGPIWMFDLPLYSLFEGFSKGYHVSGHGSWHGSGLNYPVAAQFKIFWFHWIAHPKKPGKRILHHKYILSGTK